VRRICYREWKNNNVCSNIKKENRLLDDNSKEDKRNQMNKRIGAGFYFTLTKKNPEFWITPSISIYNSSGWTLGIRWLCFAFVIGLVTNLDW
jgi:hypothetical protein